MRRLVLFHSWPPKDSFAPLCSPFPSSFAAGHRPSEAHGLELKEMDARTVLIGHSIKGHGGPPLLWGPALRALPLPLFFTSRSRTACAPSRKGESDDGAPGSDAIERSFK
ncbi:hypothetical protein EYF80_035318 [Liparis tanakae]|uniref:Uncharacterized protein n=1 Tax=Liparis tanakae TaxID=230148 RepID=A0A4Z2GMM6_9TELE|nr:hypothetical protein EYF80_035318 [Liparis tanakae]